MAHDIYSRNVVCLKELRSFVDKIQSLASLLYTWRPFVHMFYAAMHAPAGDCPRVGCWIKQILVPLTWIRAFLKGSEGVTERIFTLDAHLRRGQRLQITTDASPWGLGGVLEADGGKK